MERIAALLGGASGAPSNAWGDDAAVVATPGAHVLICTDAGVAGVHLDTDLFPIGDLGYRTAVAALSDLAAMGASPLGVLVAICAPGDVDVVAIERDVVAACDAHGCAVIGGDLSRSATTTTVATAIGTEAAGPAVLRSGARPGDAVLVTGPLGGAAAGRRLRGEGAGLEDPLVLAHRRPAARLAEGASAAACGASSMIDVSDGLARDVRRLGAASGVGVSLGEVPRCEGASLDEALGGGEDYELVITHRDPDALCAAFESAGLRVPVRIGVTTADPSEVSYEGAPLADLGWRH